jgi:phage host-nuclease inhibitor protein Gam
MRLERFIRLKPEVNKEAILNEPEAVRDVPGLSIKQDESFSIEPFETALEEVA